MGAYTCTIKREMLCKHDNTVGCLLPTTKVDNFVYSLWVLYDSIVLITVASKGI